MSLFKKKRSEETSIIQNIAEKSGLSSIEIERKLEHANALYGASPEQFLKLSLWKVSDFEAANLVKKDTTSTEAVRKLYHAMTEHSHKTEAAIRSEIRELKQRYSDFSIGSRWYHDYGICHLDLRQDQEKLDEIVRTYQDIQDLSEEIRNALTSLDSGKCASDSLEPLKASYFEKMGCILSPERINELCNLAVPYPEHCTDKKDLALDMLFSHEFLDFSYPEYAKFGLYGKTFNEKHRYISTKEKSGIVRALSPLKTRNLLKDRYTSYKNLKAFYGRKIISIASGSFTSFKSICEKNDYLVKNVDESPFGASSSLLDVSDKEHLKDLFLSLQNELGNITLEEPVAVHPNLPSSDFLVQLILTSDASAAHLFDALARICGKMVPIDLSTGMAGDYQIPEWKNCLETAKKAILSIKGLSYAGFDMTYAENCQWVILTASSQANLIDSQVSSGKGMRYQFLDEADAISYAKIKDKNNASYKDTMYAIMTEVTDKTRKNLINELSAIRKLHPSITIPLQTYFDLGLFRFDPQNESTEIVEVLYRMDSLQESGKEIRDLIMRYKEGELLYDEIVPSYDAYTNQVAELLSPESIRFRAGFADVSDPEEQTQIAADMIASQNLLSFTSEEYVMFHFREKNLQEKMTYISRSETMELAKDILSDSANKAVSGRYRLYRLIPESFGRKIITVRKEEDYDNFLDFCSRYSSAFQKGTSSQSSKPVERIDLNNPELYPLIFHKLLRSAPVILEGTITQGEPLSRLHPSSVNTVSAITIAKDGEVEIIDTYIRIGEYGSEKDTDGLLAHVDVQTGRIDSQGIRRDGSVSDASLIGEPLPDWPLFLETVTETTACIDELTFIHWDLAYTKDGKWIIVDGNKTPSYDRYQAALGKGVRLRFCYHMAKISLPPPTQKAMNQAHMLDAMQSATKKGEKQILSEFAIIRKLHPEKPGTLQWYYNYGFCHLDPENDKDLITKKIEYFTQKTALVSTIQEKLSLLDKGLLTYEEIAPLYNQYVAIMRDILSPELIRDYCDDLRYILPGMDPDSEESASIAADLRGSIEILGFFKSEYISFHLFERSLAEKREFIASRDAFAILGAISPKSQIDLLRNKYDTYLLLSEYYGRKVLKISSSEDYPIFDEFCDAHSSFVKKAPSAAFGKGIEKVTLRNKEMRPYIFEKLLSSHKEYIILEELIFPHDSIQKLNPSSVNTVRVNVYLDENGNTHIIDSFMKVGRSGSFVDNGGAGGIFVHIDYHSGVFDSSGIDEHGIIYPEHPDHGYPFIGYQLPAWDECLRISQEAIFHISDLRFVGWDLTYTETGKWIIVEGNGMSQFIAQQSTIQKGIRKRFHQEMGYPEKFPDLKRETADENNNG